MVQGKLWVWPDATPEGVKASERVLPVVIPELDSGDFGGNWYARDLPYGFDTLLENLAGEGGREGKKEFFFLLSSVGEGGKEIFCLAFLSWGGREGGRDEGLAANE